MREGIYYLCLFIRDLPFPTWIVVVQNLIGWSKPHLTFLKSDDKLHVCTLDVNNALEKVI